jgi:HK97 family phage prohead protease
MPMTDLLFRSTPSPASPMRSDSAGRTVFGIVVPFNDPATVNDGAGEYREQFTPGSFARTIAQRGHKVRLHVMHDAAKSLPVGKATELEERPEGLFGAFSVPHTRAGDDLLTAIAEGLADSFSIGFTPIAAQTRAGIVTRTEVALREVSVVHTPAYAAATIAGVRSGSPSPVSADAFRRRIQLLSERFPHA